MILKYPIIPGTTLILLATDGLAKYREATGAVLDRATGLLGITSTQYANLQSLFFTAGGVRIYLLSIRELILIFFSVFSPTDYL
jgi:cathepsin E